MARLSQAAQLDDAFIALAASWYADNDVPQAFRDVDPRVLRKAKALAGGDWRRCVVDDNGAVTVFNHPVWSRR